jgi:hypothetical protein
VTPGGARTFLFGKVYHVSDGEETLVNNQVAPIAIEGTPGESQQVEFELVGFQRQFAAGDTLRVALASTDAGFSSARQGAAVAIDHAGSTLSLPVVGARGGDGGDGADVSVTREADSSVLTGGAHTRQELAVEGGPTFVRDRVPKGWIVAAADRPYTRTAPPETEENYIEFTGRVEDGTPGYIARAPSGVDETGIYTFGPVEVSDDGEEWTVLEGTDTTVLLVGTDT